MFDTLVAATKPGGRVASEEPMMGGVGWRLIDPASTFDPKFKKAFTELSAKETEEGAPGIYRLGQAISQCVVWPKFPGRVR